MRQEEAYSFVTPQNVDIGLIDPDFTPDPEVPEQTSYISNYVDTAETVLFSSNFTDPVEGWRAYFDEASAINFYIVNDVMGNVDGGNFYSSDYLYKNDNNPLIYMGPIWDFDVSAGQRQFMRRLSVRRSCPGCRPVRQAGINSCLRIRGSRRTLLSNGTHSRRRTSSPHGWPPSGRRLGSLWNNRKRIISAAGRCRASRFGQIPEAAGSYAGEVQYLIDWLNLRIGYLDSVFNNKAQTSTTLERRGRAADRRVPCHADGTGQRRH